MKTQKDLNKLKKELIEKFTGNIPYYGYYLSRV